MATPIWAPGIGAPPQQGGSQQNSQQQREQALQEAAEQFMQRTGRVWPEQGLQAMTDAIGRFHDPFRQMPLQQTEQFYDFGPGGNFTDFNPLTRAEPFPGAQMQPIDMMGEGPLSGQMPFFGGGPGGPGGPGGVGVPAQQQPPPQMAGPQGGGPTQTPQAPQGGIPPQLMQMLPQIMQQLQQPQGGGPPAVPSGAATAPPAQGGVDFGPRPPAQGGGGLGPEVNLGELTSRAFAPEGNLPETQLGVVRPGDPGDMRQLQESLRRNQNLLGGMKWQYGDAFTGTDREQQLQEAISGLEQQLQPMVPDDFQGPLWWYGRR